MKIEIVNDDRPTPLMPQKILADGAPIGELTPSLQRDGSISWHAVLQAKECRLGCGLLQGHGSSHLSAVKNAIESAREEAKKYAEAVEKFAGIFGV